MLTPQESRGIQPQHISAIKLKQDIEHAIDDDVWIITMPGSNLDQTKTIHMKQCRDLISTYYIYYKLIPPTLNNNYLIPKKDYELGETATLLLKHKTSQIITQEEYLLNMRRWS